MRYFIGIILLILSLGAAETFLAQPSQVNSPQAVDPVVSPSSKTKQPEFENQELSIEKNDLKISSPALPGSTQTLKDPVSSAPDKQNLMHESNLVLARPASSGKTTSPAALTLTQDKPEKNSIDLAPKSKARPPNNIPEGFESLFDDQSSLVDVYYGGRFLGAAMATFNPESIRFEDPAPLVDKIPNMLAPAEVLKALHGDIPTNQEFRCFYTGQSNCGILDPEVAGVIFNEDNFRVDIFINPELLSVQQAVSYIDNHVKAHT